MPDALSKTVPIWCTVLNRIVSTEKKWAETFFPEESVSAQEISIIESLLPSFVNTFKNCGVDITSISTLLDRPLRPIFVTPDSTDFEFPNEYYYPVILLTASSLVSCGHKRIGGGFVYIQGAADDEESWGNGLTSLLFWDNYKKLLDCTEEQELISTIEEIVGNNIPGGVKEDLSPIGSTCISLGTGTANSRQPAIFCCADGDSISENDESLYVYIPRKSKPYTIMTQTLFPAVISFAIKHDILNYSQISIIATNLSRQVLDLSITTTLILLCLFFNDKGFLRCCFY